MCPNGGRGDQHPHPGPAEDVADLLRSVEVDDGDHHRPEEGGGVEGDRRLHPVGQLERHRVARAHPPGGQGPGQTPGPPVQVAERAPPGPGARVDPEGLVGVAGERLVELVTQGPVVPETVGEPALLERRRAPVRSGHGAGTPSATGPVRPTGGDRRAS